MRIKVMQGLFALEHSKTTNYQISKDIIKQAFEPDWNEKPTADYDEIEKNRQFADWIFENNYQNSQNLNNIQADIKVKQLVIQAINQYQNQITKDKNFFSKSLLTSTDKMNELYLSILLLLPALADLASQERERKEVSYTQKDIPLGHFKLNKNSIIQAIKAHKILESESIKRNINWQTDREILREVYKNVLKNDTLYQEYENKLTTTFEEDKEICNHILKSLVFSQMVYNHFELTELYLENIGDASVFKEKSFPETTEIIKENLKESLHTFLDSLSIVFTPIQMEQSIESIFNQVHLQVKPIQNQIKAIFDKSKQDKDKPKIKSSEVLESEKKETEGKLFAELLIYDVLKIMVSHFSEIVAQKQFNEVNNQKQILDAMNLAIEKFFELITYKWHKESQIKIFIKSEQQNTSLYNFFDASHLYWEEDCKNIQNMVIKTIRNIESEENNDFQLMELTRNWEEDKLFYVDLFKKCLENESQYLEFIAEKSQNWDVSRLAILDKVILKMAICEMIYFYSIPTKASINEYIELAKVYSTPKSSSFINGLLDALAQDLTKRKIIKKSGRGLLDNQ